mgnify:CR=1 FL=1
MTPEAALAALEQSPGSIDVVVLDIEMPVMDGLTALPLLLRAAVLLAPVERAARVGILVAARTHHEHRHGAGMLGGGDFSDVALRHEHPRFDSATGLVEVLSQGANIGWWKRWGNVRRGVLGDPFVRLR